jgi:hypothetical protein
MIRKCTPTFPFTSIIIISSAKCSSVSFEDWSTQNFCKQIGRYLFLFCFRISNLNAWLEEHVLLMRKCMGFIVDIAQQEFHHRACIDVASDVGCFVSLLGHPISRPVCCILWQLPTFVVHMFASIMLAWAKIHCLAFPFFLDRQSFALCPVFLQLRHIPLNLPPVVTVSATSLSSLVTERLGVIERNKSFIQLFRSVKVKVVSLFLCSAVKNRFVFVRSFLQHNSNQVEWINLLRSVIVRVLCSCLNRTLGSSSDFMET